MKPLKLLFLEDCPDDVILIERELMKANLAFTSLVVTKRDEFALALKDYAPDAILSDHSMPGFNSIEAFHICREHEKEANVVIPFILVTGHHSEEFAMQTIKLGVDDYILKDRLKRLPVALTNALEKSRIENERKRYLREVITKEAVMKEAEELAGLGSWQCDVATGAHTWSDGNYRIYGYEPGEVEPGWDAFYRVVHPEEMEKLRNAIEHLLEHMEFIDGVFRVIDNKGRQRYIHAKVQVHRDESGVPYRLVGLNHDITPQRLAEMELIRKKQEYESLFDRHPDPVYSINPQGILTNFNGALERISGFTAAQLKDIDFRRLVYPEDLPHVMECFSAVLCGKTRRFHARLLTASGTVVSLDITCMPIVVYGEVVGVHGVAKEDQSASSYKLQATSS